MKILMFNLLSACDLSFWHMLLGMLLPFLLGLLLGWFLWARYKAMSEDLQAKLTAAKKRNDELESEVGSLSNRNKTLSSELSVSRNAQSKLESDLSANKTEHTEYVTKAHSWEIDANKAKSDFAKSDKENSALKGDLKDAKKRVKDLEDRAQNALKATGGLGAAAMGAIGVTGLTSDVSEDNKDVDDPKIEMAHRDYDGEYGKKDEPSGLKTGALGGVKIGAQGIAPVGGGDNLTKVEGIGPKIAGLFNDDGIFTWLQLSEKDPKDLKIILDKAGSRYQMHDPGTWPKQAKMLSIGDMDKLNAYQDYLIGGRDPKSIVKDLADKMPDLAAGTKIFGHTIEMDDLELIEGIGPAIASLLHKNDIKTWASLATSKVNRLQEILDTEGMRFKTAVPNTWPKQATMAYSGKWSKLKELQDRLDGGKG